MEQGILILAGKTQQIKQVITEFPDVFSDSPGMARGVQHHIHTPPGVIVHTPMYPTPLALQGIIEQEVQNILKSMVKPSGLRTKASCFSKVLYRLQTFQ